MNKSQDLNGKICTFSEDQARSFRLNSTRCGARPPPIWLRIFIWGLYIILRDYLSGFSHLSPRPRVINPWRWGEFQWYSKKPILAILIYLTSSSLTLHSGTLYQSIMFLKIVSAAIFHANSKYAIEKLSKYDLDGRNLGYKETLNFLTIHCFSWNILKTVSPVLDLYFFSSSAG